MTPAIALTGVRKRYDDFALHDIDLTLPRGQVMPQHQVPGEITIQCLLGEVEITTPQRGCLLRVGELVLLPGGEPHALRALQDAKLLLTLLFASPR